MIEIKDVQGTQETVQEIEFNIDTVYVRNNITKIETEDFVGWKYDETQYTYNEWIELDSNKISILTQQIEQQDEINASLTYELMMLQEPITLASLNNNHSPKFNLINSWFNKGYWNEDMLLNAVEKHYITEEEMNEIIGK